VAGQGSLIMASTSRSQLTTKPLDPIDHSLTVTPSKKLNSESFVNWNLFIAELPQENISAG